MIDRTILVSVAGTLIVLLLVLELVRRRSLREEYALAWLICGVILFVLSFSRPLLSFISQLLGIHYPPSALFLIGFFLFLLVLLHFSIIISRQAGEIKDLVQEFALLQWRVEQNERRTEHPARARSEESE
jgi:hypothetical protein